jgi:NaMN:DMB phosphoribosyltransferase
MTQSRAVAITWIAAGLLGVACLVWTLWRARAGSATHIAVATVQSPTPASQPDPLLTADLAFNDCAVPAQPTELPDGATASMQQMQQAHAAVTAFDAATNVYLKCVDASVSRVAQQDQGAASSASVRLVDSLGVTLHNAAVDRDRAVAERLNQQIRIFKAKHGS